MTPILIGPMLNPINTSLISVALVPIAVALHVSSAVVIWLVAVLYLTSAVSQPAMGTLADRFGPKRIYQVGLLVTVLAGAAPLVSHTFAAALASRILLGVGTSAAYPTALALIRDQSLRLRIDTPPALLSGLSISSLVTTAIGPVLGGVLIAGFGWAAVFAINIPLAGLTFVLAWRWLPTDDQARYGDRSQKLTEAVDLAGVALFAVTITSLLFFLLEISVAHLWLLAVFVAGLVGLIRHETHRRKPFIDVRLLATNGALPRTYLRLLLTYTGFCVFLYAVSQWLQTDVGMTAYQAGLAQLPTAVVAGLASIAVARTTSIRRPLLVTAAAPILGGLTLALVSSSSPLWVVLVAAALFGIPAGVGSVANQAALYRQTPPEQIATAAGLSRTSTNLGAIASSSLIGIIFGRRPSDAGMNTIGWIVLALSVVLLVLTMADRSLRDSKKATPPRAHPPHEGPTRLDAPTPGLLHDRVTGRPAPGRVSPARDHH